MSLRQRMSYDERRAATLERRQTPREPSTLKPLHVGHYGGTVRAVEPKPKLRKRDKVRQDIRDSARGEECTVRLLGVCNHDPQTTVWSHYPLGAAGKGMGTKSLDLAGCYSCSACHDVVDGRVPTPTYLSRNGVMLSWHEGHMRSLVRLAEKGLL